MSQYYIYVNNYMKVHVGKSMKYEQNTNQKINTGENGRLNEGMSQFYIDVNTDKAWMLLAPGGDGAKHKGGASCDVTQLDSGCGGGRMCARDLPSSMGISALRELW